MEYFEFLGLFYLDENSTNVERIWKRYKPEKENIILNAQIIEKEVYNSNNLPIN